MKHLSILARIITPAAMVVFLAHEISQSMIVAGLWYWLLLVGSFATAIGIEIVGILAGHALEGYWRLADMWRSLLALVLLLAYTVTAVIILRHNPAMVLVPVIAAIVYLLASLTNGLEAAVSRQAEETAVSSAFDLEQAALDRGLERKMKAAEMKLKHEERLARIEAKVRASTEPAQSKSEPAQSNYECGDCNRSFSTVQALNAHVRFCLARVPVNGAAK